MERRVLVTGFEPWAHHARNPAQALAEGVDGWRHGDLVATGLVLPVARDAGRGTALAALRDLRPSVVLHLGLAASRQAITVERWAHNHADFVVPDNSGAQPRGECLREDGAARLASSLEVAAVVGALSAAGMPAAASATAGTFVCNAVLYGTLDWAATHAYPGAVAFIHLPAPETLPLVDQERALDHLLRLLAHASWLHEPSSRPSLAAAEPVPSLAPPPALSPARLPAQTTE